MRDSFQSQAGYRVVFFKELVGPDTFEEIKKVCVLPFVPSAGLAVLFDNHVFGNISEFSRSVCIDVRKFVINTVLFDVKRNEFIVDAERQVLYEDLREEFTDQLKAEGFSFRYDCDDEDVEDGTG